MKTYFVYFIFVIVTVSLGLRIKKIEKFKIYERIKLLRPYDIQRTTFSISECASMCLSDSICRAASFNTYTSTCELNEKSPFNEGVAMEDLESWIVISADIDGWQLVFRATAGIGIPTFAAFIGTSIPPVPTDACRLPYTNSCKTHFRDPLLDKWESQSVKQVKYALLKDGAEVVAMIFNNLMGDKITRWFSSDRLVNSTYHDMLPDTTYNFLSMEGIEEIKRRFYISSQWYECPYDVGWICVFDEELDPCSYGIGLQYPFFAYLPDNHKGILQSSNIILYVK